MDYEKPKNKGKNQEIKFLKQTQENFNNYIKYQNPEFLLSSNEIFFQNPRKKRRKLIRKIFVDQQ